MIEEKHSVLNERVEQRVRESFARQGLMTDLGASLVEIRQYLVAVRMPYRPEVSQQDRSFHAGGLSAI
ncbi:hypothetical protein N8E89_21780 (plasmid) [Phyllobacterium sp. A18/5-2]|uniref:hypothetical protein n=1 Tax=Phyllobacterium sp. A18/5-2 TaxID=2978392 RepID=UPI0021C6DACD|nr:hypothetical protein [Phyllobacterium sp. A18/5-2]UXN67136.1 hypothetical protein N8E89_21780 [Phyllobacterium sp. A18/5-2]